MGCGFIAGQRPVSGHTLRACLPPGHTHLPLPPPPGRSFPCRSYDAGNVASTGYNPVEAMNAHCSLFPCDRVLMGVEVPPEAWGGNIITVPEATNLASAVRSRGAGGMMIWSLQKQGTPSAQQLSSTICSTLGLGPCSTPLFP